MSVCAVAALLLFLAGFLIARGPSEPALKDTIRAVEFEYRFVVRDLPTGAQQIAAYVPVPRANSRQDLASYRVHADYPHRELVEPEYGNRFLRFDLSAAPKGNGGQISLAVVYRVKRSAYRAVDNPANADDRAPQRFARFLAPDRLVPVGGKIAEEARSVAGGVDDPFQQARRLYDHVVATVRYDKSGQGWGRGDALYACDVRTGNCTDFHSLFIAEARAVGIPARFIMGVPLPENATAGVIAGYHCWAEFYIEGVGWIPVDASEASKHPEKREAYFGALDAHRIEFTVGRDIQLPGSDTGPVNYSIYPHVEVDGLAHARVDTTFSFRGWSPPSVAEDAYRRWQLH